MAALSPAERAANSLPASPPARDASAAAIAEVVAALSPEEQALNGLASVPAEGARPGMLQTYCGHVSEKMIKSISLRYFS